MIGLRNAGALFSRLIGGEVMWKTWQDRVDDPGFNGELTGRKVGTDRFGTVYYESRAKQAIYNRTRRWAIFPGRDPSVVPWNPSGATPTIVRCLPLTINVSPMTFGLRSKRLVQYAWLRTTTSDSPSF